MSEIKTTEDGLEIKANEITLEGPETEYVTLAVVEYDPYEGMDCEGNEKDKTLVRLPTFCRQVDEDDKITFSGKISVDASPESKPWNAPEEWIWTGYVLAEASYEVRDPRLHMLLLGFGQSLTSLPVVETKIEEVRVEN